MELVKRCPFLKRVPGDFLRKCGPSVFSYAEKCPIMTQVLATPESLIKTTPKRGFKTCAQTSSSSSSGSNPDNSNCPFLATHAAKVTAHAEDIKGSHLKPASSAGSCPFTSGKFIQDALAKGVASSYMQNPALQRPEVYVTNARAVENAFNSQAIDATQVESHFRYEHFFENMIQKKKEDHSYRVFRKVNRDATNFPMGNDYSFSNSPEQITVWCSNDYLGMSRHPVVLGAAKYVLERHGVGAGGTRNISGTSLFHGLLEQSLADWHQKEAGLLFTSCYVANDTALFTLGQHLPGCIMFSDKGNHASMIHGIRTSGAKKVIYRHNDADHLEEVLSKADPSAPKIVVFESVHSMTGAVCPVEKICDIAHKYNALTFVDEVHAVGLYGHRGAGIGDRDNCLAKMDIISGTLGKAVGVIGGYLVGKSSVIDMLRSYGSGFIFTTSLPPDKVYAALTSIEILKTDEGRELRKRHQAAVKSLRTMLVRRGLPVEYAPSHIVPVHAGDPDKCTRVSQMLQKQHGMYIQSINYPTVARGEEKLRIAPTPFHTEAMMEKLVDALDEAWKSVGLPYVRGVCPTPKCQCLFACEKHAVAV